MHAHASETQLRFRIPATSQPTCPFKFFLPTLPGCARVPQLRFHNHLPRRRPDRLEEAVTLCEPVHAVVGLAHGADEAGESVDLVLAGVATVLIDLSDADLDGGVVLGLDDASGSGLRGD
jgi:hypothetical protein